MSVPNLPPFWNMNFTQADGYLTSDGYLYMDQTFQSLNTVVNFFNNGVEFPPKTTADITALEPGAKSGTVWFNTSLAKLQVKTAAGVIETIQSV